MKKKKEITHRHNVILFTFSEASDRTSPLRAIEIGAGFKSRSVSAEEKASANLPAYRSTYLLTRLLIPTYLPACLPTCHPAYLFSCLPTCHLAYLSSCLPTCHICCFLKIHFHIFLMQNISCTKEYIIHNFLLFYISISHRGTTDTNTWTHDLKPPTLLNKK